MRSARTGLLLLGALLLTAAARAADASERKFPLRDGDTWVLAGDSITAQHLHTNYFEAFCFARYPHQTFRFRNSGVGGDTISKVLARFDWDVAAWKPTVVSVELGMNDQNGYSVEQYIANMKKLTERIRALKARPVLFTASPINNGSTSAHLDGDARLNAYADALKKFAEKEDIPFADQFHPLLNLWGKNWPRESLARSLPSLRELAKDDTLPGVEHLRAFLTELAKDPRPLVSMQGDAVHPGPPGQLTMAAALLKGLGADEFVSSVTLDADGKVHEAKGCKVTDARAEDGKITFDRLDDCLPFPIPDDARPVLSIDPTILELSQYTLQVHGLKGDHYRLRVNGQDVGTVSGADLDKGVNLTQFGAGPIAAQGKEILAAVAAKEGLVGQWRGVSHLASAPGAAAETKTRLDELTKRVDDADAMIRAAARPRKLHFELTAGKAAAAGREEKKVETRFFEMRTYHAAAGKMAALDARFRDHTIKLFEKHGMEVIGFWHPADPKEAVKTLVYILAYPSREAREASWKAFQNDPDWQAAKAASEQDGKLVDKVDSVYLDPTDYSPIK